MNIRDNFLTPEELSVLHAYPKNWQYGWTGTPESLERYYNTGISDAGGKNRQTVSTPVALSSVVGKLKHRPTDRLIRAYFNKTIAGMEPAAHRDTRIRHGTDYTVVVYLVPLWETVWGGETLVYEDDGNALAATVRPGRVVTLMSGKLHQAKAATALCPIERVVAVFKYAQDSSVENFMLSRGWDTVKHTMGYTKTFAEHLLETGALLARAGAPEYLVAAGALHAVYGTEFFKLPNPPTRAEVEALVGAKAEQLVHAFCTTPRAEAKSVGSVALQAMAWANEYNKTKLKEVLNGAAGL